ncbi:MAG: SapC family protein [Proteobacteria bacterium]|nr:SapC family protein [Pseudomonadota bacterium]
MKIPLPPGYVSAAPFDRERHRRLGIRSSGARFAQRLNVIYLTAAEFPRASHDYPIVFAHEDSGDMVPVALTALEDDSNLFVDSRGVWAEKTYCPAYVRRYPFFTATVSNEGTEQSLICVEEQALTRSAPPLISSQGEPTKHWRDIEILITEMNIQQQDTLRFCTYLTEMGLFEPFEADFHPRGMPEIRVAGLFRISEQKLREVAAEQLQQLLYRGYLARIYAHLLSFENFNRLLSRHVEYARPVTP